MTARGPGAALEDGAVVLGSQLGWEEVREAGG